MTPTTPDPLCLIAELTYRCPLQCPYCSNPLHLSRYTDELSTETWQRVIREAADLGVVQIHLSGGEPLLREDLSALVATARDAGLYTHLITAGTLLDTQQLQSLKRAGLDAIQISVQAATPPGSDRLAGVPSFAKKQAGFQNAKALGFPVTLNVVLHRQNLKNLPAIIELALQWRADRLELAHAQYVGWAFHNRRALLPTKSQLAWAADIVAEARERWADQLPILHVLPDYHQDTPKPCLQGWGRVFMTIAPDGAALPCHAAREIPGLHFPSATTSSLRDIWFSSEVFQKFRGTEWMPEPCRNCDRRELDFGGCRCQAFLLTGNAGNTDPVCHLSPHHHMVKDLVAQAEEAETDRLAFRRWGDVPSTKSDVLSTNQMVANLPAMS